MYFSCWLYVTSRSIFSCLGRPLMSCRIFCLDCGRPGLGPGVPGLAEGCHGECQVAADQRSQGSGKAAPGHGRQQAQSCHLQRCGKLTLDLIHLA